MNLRAVLIDDEDWVRQTIKRIGKWHETGFTIVGEAADGVSGLACVRELNPDLVITDMNMPGIDGAELLKELTADGNRAKVIVISGYDDYKYTRQAMHSRAADYLLKPVKEDELNALLARCAWEIRDERNLAPTADQGIVQTNLSLIGLADADWIREYNEFTDVLATCILSHSLPGVSRALGIMERLLSRISGEFIDLRLLIRINYDFQWLVEKLVIAQNLQPGQVLAPEKISFPLSGLVTPADLVAHWKGVLEYVICCMTDEMQRKNRIDIRKICEWISSRYTESITLEEIADRFYVSREYLSTLFHKETGKTFSDYIVSLRMEKARELITAYGIPIQRAAEMVGYIDISNFYRSFKKYFGMTPGELKKKDE